MRCKIFRCAACTLARLVHESSQYSIEGGVWIVSQPHVLLHEARRDQPLTWVATTSTFRQRLVIKTNRKDDGRRRQRLVLCADQQRSAPGLICRTLI